MSLNLRIGKPPDPGKCRPFRQARRENPLVRDSPAIPHTLDNRRLEAFRRAGVQIPYRMATQEEVARQGWKFAAKNGGTSIRIRMK